MTALCKFLAKNKHFENDASLMHPDYQKLVKKPRFLFVLETLLNSKKKKV